MDLITKLMTDNMKSKLTDTKNFEIYNKAKSDHLLMQKPKLSEIVLYYNKMHIKSILPKNIFSKQSLVELLNIPMMFASRSLLEYNPMQVHPIPYILTRFWDEEKQMYKYFFTLREGGSTESRLVGKLGNLGGHVGLEDYVNGDDSLNLLSKALFRELEEEAGITSDIILDVDYEGMLYNDDGSVDSDHLGVIYTITIDNDKIDSEEEGVLSGLWVYQDEIPEYYERFENWSKIIVENLFADELIAYENSKYVNFIDKQNGEI